ncbi:unnamed protein product [[Candida] boidinii]|nr:unnamed protein product [[Candida] boidinii]
MQEDSIELKYHVLSAIANNLRYPNAHTHWLINLVLHYFGSKNTWNNDKTKLQVQEIISRVLLERIISNKPHPWGLLVCLTEILKNDEFKFFELPFTKLNTDIQRVFEALLQHIKNSSIKKIELTEINTTIDEANMINGGNATVASASASASA